MEVELPDPEVELREMVLDALMIEVMAMVARIQLLYLLTDDPPANPVTGIILILPFPDMDGCIVAGGEFALFLPTLCCLDSARTPCRVLVSDEPPLDVLDTVEPRLRLFSTTLPATVGCIPIFLISLIVQVRGAIG